VSIHLSGLPNLLLLSSRSVMACVGGSKMPLSVPMFQGQSIKALPQHNPVTFSGVPGHPNKADESHTPLSKDRPVGAVSMKQKPIRGKDAYSCAHGCCKPDTLHQTRQGPASQAQLGRMLVSAAHTHSHTTHTACIRHVLPSAVLAAPGSSFSRCMPSPTCPNNHPAGHTQTEQLRSSSPHTFHP
jgi:hypothetical protein